MPQPVTFPCPYARLPYRPGGRLRRPVHGPDTARGRLATAIDDVLRGWTNAEVAAHSANMGCPVSAPTVGRARSGCCVPTAETVKTLAVVAGADPAGLLNLRTTAIWGPYIPVDHAGVTRSCLSVSLGESLGSLRNRGHRPVSYRTLARRTGMAEATVRDRLAGVWPAGWRQEAVFFRQLDHLLHALGVPREAVKLWHVPARRALDRTARIRRKRRPYRW